MERRALSATLPTGNLAGEALDFVRGPARPAPQTAVNTAVPVQPAVLPAALPPSNKSRLPSHITDTAQADAEAGLTSMTVRVPRVVPPGLLLASVDRKLKRQRPWTQQEIVAEALTHWLKQQGYLL